MRSKYIMASWQQPQALAYPEGKMSGEEAKLNLNNVEIRLNMGFT